MASSRGLSADQLERLAQFDTPTICNVIELFEVRPRDTGYMDQRIGACFPELPPMVGYALPATFRASKPRGACDPAYQSVAKQVEMFADLPGPAVIVFEDVDKPTVAATFGEMMCRTYQAFGAAGLITSGAGRDIDQVEAIGFPCFVESINPAHGYCHIPTVGEPVTVGGLRVAAGDLLHADRNGVTSIPNDIAGEVADVAQRFVDTEQILVQYLSDGGTPTSHGYIEAVEQMAEQIGALRDEIRSRANA